MKKINKNITIVSMSLFVMLGFLGLTKVSAAVTPFFGVTSSYTILSSTYTNTVPGTSVTGDIGFTTPPAVIPAGIHPNYGSGAPYATAGTDQGILLSALDSQPCTFTFPDTAIDLSTDVSHGTIGVYTPGVYCTQATRAASIGTAGITLNGAGTYIFRVQGAFTTVMNSVVTLSGASACDVFWTPTGATTLGANSTFKGNNIDASGITVGANVNWVGRALSFGGTVTTSVGDILTLPTSCTLPPSPTPLANTETGGVYSMPWVTPGIHVTETPTPESLPNGPGLVLYNYSVTNPGNIELSNITLVDDTCSPVIFVSGDINNNSKLGTTETWKYTCTTNLSQTTTNRATATGYADFATAKDTASTTVIVATPLVVAPSPIVSGGSTTTQTTVNVSSAGEKSPAFPDTGIEEEQSSYPWNLLVLVVIVFVSVLELTKSKKDLERETVIAKNL